LEWSNKIRSKIIGSYYVDSPNNDTFIDIAKFTNWAISGGKKLKTLNRLQETIYESRPDLQSAYPVSTSNFYQEFSFWLKNFGKKEIILENKYEFIINILMCFCISKYYLLMCFCIDFFFFYLKLKQ
jgi:hypothetical protein